MQHGRDARELLGGIEAGVPKHPLGSMHAVRVVVDHDGLGAIGVGLDAVVERILRRDGAKRDLRAEAVSALAKLLDDLDHDWIVARNGVRVDGASGGGGRVLEKWHCGATTAAVVFVGSYVAAAASEVFLHSQLAEAKSATAMVHHDFEAVCGSVGGLLSHAFRSNAYASVYRTRAACMRVLRSHVTLCLGVTSFYFGDDFFFGTGYIKDDWASAPPEPRAPKQSWRCNRPLAR
jgi:hypothetical protein